jgi:TIR domain
MKVFLSWSGGRSKRVAETLGGWLSQVIQAVEPWISSGIDKGARWQTEITDRLEQAKVGIVCLTSGNLTQPWVLFEAGALSKTKDSYVCTFLLDVAAGDIEPPLGQFQHTLFAKPDIFKLVQTINRFVQESGERALSEQTLGAVFEKFWPELEQGLKKIAEQEEEKPIQRPERALLEEILAILRDQEQRRRQAAKAQLDEKIRRSARQLVSRSSIPELSPGTLKRLDDLLAQINEPAKPKESQQP